MMGDPRVAAQIVKHQIDDRIRDAEVHRTARAARQAASSGPATAPAQSRRRTRVRQHAGVTNPAPDQLPELDPSPDRDGERVLID